MPMDIRSKVNLLALHALCVGVGALGVTGVHAQTAKAKAPAASAPAEKTGTLGTTAAKGGRLMTRDELRACMNRQTTINRDRDAIDSQQAQLSEARKALTSDADESTALKAEITQALAAVRGAEVKVRENNAAIQDWNRRLQELEEATGVRNLERRKLDLMDEQKELRAKSIAAGAELNEKGSAYEALVKRFNARAADRDAKVQAWNKRNAELSEASRRLADERESWAADCAGRRFREEDEQAIQAGK